MTRNDTAVVGALVLMLAIIAGIVGLPAIQATLASPTPVATPTETIDVRPYRAGLVGRPVSISPLTARSQADRDLVALIFSGLVRIGPNGTVVPDLAARWSVDDDGKVWTFDLQPDATWHDGEPVTADDVVFTIDVLKDPAYTGPAATSWSEVTVRAESPTRVTFTLATPLGGFLQAATQPIAPFHLLGGIPIEALPDDPFGQSPIGAGPFALDLLDDDHVELVPAARFQQQDPGGPDVGSGDPSVAPSDSLSTSSPSLRPNRPVPYLHGMEFRFFDDVQSLAQAYRDGDLDAATGLTPDLAMELSSQPDSRLLRYPASTLTAALLNQRPAYPAFRDAGIRTALLAAIDRGALVRDVFASLAAPAQGPIPPSSWLFDPEADPVVPFSVKDAEDALKKAKWTKKDDGWHLPGAAAPLTIEVVSPQLGANPTAYAAAEVVVDSWRAIGITVTHVPLAPSVFVERLTAGDFAVAVTDVNMGLDPDLYALLASSQTQTGGSNIIGVQDSPSTSSSPRPASPGPRRSGSPPIRRSRWRSGRVASCFRWPSRTRSWCSATRSKDPSSDRSPIGRSDFGMC